LDLQIGNVAIKYVEIDGRLRPVASTVVEVGVIDLPEDMAAEVLRTMARSDAVGIIDRALVKLTFAYGPSITSKQEYFMTLLHPAPGPEQEALFHQNVVQARLWLFMIRLVQGKATETEQLEMQKLLEKIIKKMPKEPPPESKSDSEAA
jgi:hypothetical protein